MLYVYVMLCYDLCYVRFHSSLAFVAGLKGLLMRATVTDEGSLPEIAQYSPYNLPFNICLLLPKDQTSIFSLLLLQLLLCRVAALKSLPVHHP